MLQALFARRPANLKDDLLSGLTVALALVPEAVAFALIAKVDVMVGLHAAVIMGLFASIFGGRPGMITGATGAMAVVLMSMGNGIRDHFGYEHQAEVAWLGPAMLEYIFLAVLMAGIIQITCGVLRLGKFIRMVPHSVMLGFVNGLAILICKAQFGYFQDPDTKEWLVGSAMAWMIGLTALTMAIIAAVPRLTKVLPAPLMGILITTGVVLLFTDNAAFVGDLKGMNLDALAFWERMPSFHMPFFGTDTTAAAAAAGVTLPSLWSLETIMLLLPYSCILAAVGLIESLMTMSLIDEITETRGRGNRECIGQGLGNIVCGFFSSMGGCAMIGQSMININSGGRGRLSGIAAAVILLLFILFGGKLIGMIPIAALVGVMFMVVIGTFEWSSLFILHRVPKADAIVIVLVAAVTFYTDNLALAVGIGVVIAAVAFAWKHALHIHAVPRDEDGVRCYHVEGILFFASVTSFREQFSVADDPEQVVLDFAEARVSDHSGIEAIASLVERYEKAGKKLRIRHLSPECTTLLGKAKGIVDVDALTDPIYHVADDALA